MKKNNLIIILIAVTILFSSLVSANIFSDVWSRITGMASGEDPPISEGEFEGQVPGGTYLRCDYENEQCVTIQGYGQDECGSDEDCKVTESVYHSFCNEGDYCVQVLGQGENDCMFSTDCGNLVEPGLGELGEVKHTVCQNEQCVDVPGAGENECSSEVDCITGEKHSICQNEQCVIVPGEGENKCSFNSECKSKHSICQNEQCIPVEGPGNDECRFDVECIELETCSDTDITEAFQDGINPNIRAEISGRIIITEDWCKNNEVLIEYYCGMDKKIKEKLISCNDLGLECFNGTCVQKPTPIQYLVRRIIGIQ